MEILQQTTDDGTGRMCPLLYLGCVEPLIDELMNKRFCLTYYTQCVGFQDAKRKGEINATFAYENEVKQMKMLNKKHENIIERILKCLR